MASELEVGKVVVGDSSTNELLVGFESSSQDFSLGANGTNFMVCANATDLDNNELLRISSTGLCTFSNGIKNEQGIYGGQITIADDAVGTITPPRQGVMMAISYGNDSAYPAHQNMSGLIWCDTGSSLTCAKMTSEGSSLSVGTSDLTVAAGVDGNINIAAISGTIQIKNRVNSTIIIWYNFIA